MYGKIVYIDEEIGKAVCSVHYKWARKLNTDIGDLSLGRSRRFRRWLVTLIHVTLLLLT